LDDGSIIKATHKLFRQADQARTGSKNMRGAIISWHRVFDLVKNLFEGLYGREGGTASHSLPFNWNHWWGIVVKRMACLRVKCNQDSLFEDVIIQIIRDSDGLVII